MLYWPGGRPTNNISIEFEIRPKFVSVLIWNILNRSQWNFAHATTVELSWRVQNLIVIGWVCFKLEHSKFDRISNSIEISLVVRASASWDNACHRDNVIQYWRYCVTLRHAPHDIWKQAAVIILQIPYTESKSSSLINRSNYLWWIANNAAETATRPDLKYGRLSTILCASLEDCAFIY